MLLLVPFLNLAAIASQSASRCCLISNLLVLWSFSLIEKVFFAETACHLRGCHLLLVWLKFIKEALPSAGRVTRASSAVYWAEGTVQIICRLLRDTCKGTLRAIVCKSGLLGHRRSLLAIGCGFLGKVLLSESILRNVLRRWELLPLALHELLIMLIYHLILLKMLHRTSSVLHGEGALRASEKLSL